MKALILTILTFGSSLALAEPFICLTEVLSEAEIQSRADFPLVLASYPSCKTMHNIGLGYQAVSITLTGAGIYAACTGVGVPFAVALESSALAASTIALIVGELPCDGSDDDKKIEEKAKKFVCLELERNGIPCVPGI